MCFEALGSSEKKKRKKRQNNNKKARAQKTRDSIILTPRCQLLRSPVSLLANRGVTGGGLQSARCSMGTV